MRLFIYYIIMLCAPYILAQNIKFKTYLTDQGISNNSINSIAVDDQGALWLGTWDGINYFDGHEFAVFKHIPGDSTSIANNFIHKIIKDKANRLWVYADNHQIALSNDDGTFQNFTFDAVIDDIGLNKSEEILIKSGEDFYTIVEKRFVKCTNCRFYQPQEKWKEILLQYYPNLSIKTVFKDSQGNIWLGTENSGLFYIPGDAILGLQPTDIQNYTNDPYNKFSLQSNEVYAVQEDLFGNIWIGTKDGGLSRVYKNSEAIHFIANHPKFQPYLPTETIRAVTVDAQENIWLGYYSDGVYVQNQKKIFEPLRLAFATQDPGWNKVRALYTASDGSVLGGTYAGFFRFKNGKISYYTAENEDYFPNNRIYAFDEKDNHQVYVGCWGGVALFDLNSNQFIPFENQNALTQYHIRDIKFIHNKLYLATEKNGLIIYDQGNISFIKNKDGLAEDSVFSLWFDDSNDNLWIGTLGGITVYNIIENKIVKNITENQGLSSHLVYGILGYDNQIWCSTTHGLVSIDKNTFHIQVHSGKEGFQSAEFSEGAYYIDQKGIMYFGGIKGLNFFNPDKINLKEELPILKVFVDNRHVDELYTKDYNDNNIQFTIDPTFYSESGGNIIYYKLEGYDTDWKEVDYGKNKIDYIDLPAGEYIFKTKNSRAKNRVYETKIKINNPFYSTLWFYIILAVFIIIALFLYYLYKRKLHQQREQQLEDKIAERVNIISEQKKDIFQINQKLREKNEAIIQQKEELQKLHAKVKTETMEMDKFSTFMVKEYKNPIYKISQQIHQNPQWQNSDEILQELNVLMNKLLAVDYLSQINPNEDIYETSVEIASTTEYILQSLILKLEEKHFKYHITQQVSSFWIQIDLLKFKLLLKYIIADISKFPDEHSILHIDYVLDTHQISFEFSTDNALLKENIYYITHYSPYYQACKRMADAMDIILELKEVGDKAVYRLAFKPQTIEEEQKTNVKLNWMHTRLQNELDSELPTILVWADHADAPIVRQLLPDNYNIIVEHSKDLLLSVLKSINVNLLLIYNQKLDQRILRMMQAVNKTYKTVKTLYVSESINHELEFQTLEMGIDSCVQLPISPKFIDKKIRQLLAYQKNKGQHKNIYETFENIMNSDFKNANEKIIHQALNIIQEKMSDPNFNVTELYEALGISKIKCYRIFKEVLDIPPSEFILNLKIQKAQTLFKTTQLNVAEVSYEVGFNDPKYFSKVFKKEVGVSPKKFKKDNNES